MAIRDVLWIDCPMIEVTAGREDAGPIELDTLASSLLRSVVDVSEAGPDWIRFSKRATEAAR